MRRDDQRVDFNSRPSARGDECDSPTRETAEISIHAPPRGATGVISPLSSCVLFQFTPLCEGRQVVHKPQKTAVLFQFTPLREGRLAQAELSRANQQFQFTPLREGRRFLSTNERYYCNFNSRPSARGDLPPRRDTSDMGFQFTPLREGRLLCFGVELRLFRLFQFTPLREGRR